MEDSSASSPSPAILRNRYWILRHGRSVPNERGLIVSSLDNGTKPEFGLAPQGFEQARAAGELLRKELEEMGVAVDSLKIRYSPFSRTTETARAVAGVLGIPFEGPSCEAVMGLRERYFGPSYELLSHDKYAEVWAVDEAHPYMAPGGGESVADVANRLSAVLSSSESEFHSSAILIVSHGDPLQIFQAVFSGAKENSSFLDDMCDLKVKARPVAPSKFQVIVDQATIIHDAAAGGGSSSGRRVIVADAAITGKARAPPLQLPAGAGVPDRPGVLLLARHVQCAQRPRRWRAVGPHRRRQRQHRRLRLLRRLRRPRRRDPQPPWPAHHPLPGLPHLPALRRGVPQLQPPARVPGLPRRRRRAPRRRRGAPLGGAGRHHDLLSAAQPPGHLHLPLLVPLQPRQRPRRPPPSVTQLPPREQQGRRQRQRRHLHRLHGRNAHRRGADPPLPAAAQGRPRRRQQAHRRHPLLRRHRGRRGPPPLRRLEDGAGAGPGMGQQLLLHVPVQQRQRPAVHAPHQGPQQRRLLGRPDDGLRRPRLPPRLRLRQPQEEGARRSRRLRRARHRHLGRGIRQPAQVRGSRQVARRRRPHRFQGRPPLRRAVRALLQLRPAGRHVPEPHLLDHRRAHQRLAGPQQVCGVLQGCAECRSGCLVASRLPQDAPDGPARCELGAHHCQLSLACPAGVLGRGGRGQRLGLLVVDGGRRQRQQG